MIAPFNPPLPRRWSFAWRAMIALATVLLLMAAGLRLVRQTEQSIARAEQQVARSREQRLAVDGVLDALRDAETGQRGYLLTGQERYLAPYAAASARIGDQLSRLTQASSGDAEMLDDVARLHDAASRKLAELSETIQAFRTQGAAAALALVLTGAGLRDMDEARMLGARMFARVDLVRAGALAKIYAGQREDSRELIVAALAVALLLGVTVIALLAGRERLMAAHDALRLQTARLGGAVEHMRDGVAVFDAAGRLLLSNARLLENAGWPPSLLHAGSRFADFAAAAAEWPGAPLAEPAPPARGGTVEVRLGDKTLEVWRSAMPDGGQMLTLADVSRREAAEAVARQAQKMEALGQLTGGIAHDFNNLLQVVSANLELIADRVGVGGDSWVAARLSTALAGVERAARLTRHLLAFARRQPLAPESLDTRALLVTLEEMLRRTLGERIKLEMVVSGGLWPVRADPQQLENALLNLAINARDAMPDGGVLTIEAGNAALDDEYAAANADVSPGQYVAIAVTDTGVGMSSEHLARAVEPFFTTKAEGRGTGLGLSMVYGFAKQTGGHFKLYSEFGHGTTARLYVPRSETAPRQQTRLPAASPAEGELVLVVEDEPNVRAASVATLRGLGYRTIEADGAAAALALLQGGAKPDVVFTDVVMPGPTSARALVEQARVLQPGIAVLFTSGYTENAIVHNGRLDRGVLLISKPWRTPELARKMRQAIVLASESSQAAPSRRRVLLVEDEMLVRMTTADLLADLGHDVVEVSSGAEARTRLSDDIALMIVDVGLPDMDGMELVREAKVQVPGLRAIVTSGRTVAPDGDYVVLEKPYDQQGLRSAIERAQGATDSA